MEQSHKNSTGDVTAKHLKRRVFLAGLASSTAVVGQGFAQVLPEAPFEEMRHLTVVPDDDPFARDYSDAFREEKLLVPKKRLVCHSKEVVSEQLRNIVDAGQDFSIRSTGHCFAGYSQHPELVIDTSHLDNVGRIDANGHIRVGAGAWILPIYRALAETDHVLPGGTYFSVGAAGNTMGGGIGYLSRQLGLLCDHVVSFEVVTADGKIVEASANENTDLFWALKGGGGGSFGIVTSLVFKPVKLPQSTSINWLGVYNYRDAAKLIEAWQRWTEAAGEAITTHLSFQRYTEDGILIIIKGWSLATNGATRDYLAQLIGRGKFVRDNQVPSGRPRVALDNLFEWHNFLTPTKVHLGSDFAGRHYSLGEMQDAIDVVMSQPIASTTVYFEALGGRTATDTGDVVYPHRSAKFLIYYISSIPKETMRDERKSNLETIRKGFSVATTGGIYVNYPDQDLDNWQRRYWGDNLERLVEVKRKWDPNNVFNHPQSVPLAIYGK